MRAVALLALLGSAFALAAAARLLLVPARLGAGSDLRLATDLRPTAGRTPDLDRRIGAVVAGRVPALDRSVRRRLAAAGRHGQGVANEHLGRRVRHLAVGAVVGLALAAAGSPLALLLFPLATWLLSAASLDREARHRSAAIEAQLPDVLDVLAVLLSAGLGFDDALARVGRALPGPVADEVARARQQILLGSSRAAAYGTLRGATGAPSFDAFVAALLQAEELGAPLVDATVALAAEVRREAGQRARRRAAQIAPRISLVLTTVIVPGAMVLVLAGLVLGSGVDLGPAIGR